MLYLCLLLLICAAVADFNVTRVGEKQSAVSTLDLNAYLGDWFQMYSDAIVIKSFEDDAYCATAEYTLQDDGKIGVRNYAKKSAPDGKDYIIEGYAYQYNKDVEGELKVHFDPPPGQDVAPFDAPYWVLALGPIENDQYTWAIVSDNLSQFLFVLARNVADFKSKYEDEVLATVKNMGFTGYKAPIEMYQGTDCVYDSHSDGSKATVKAVQGGSCESITDESKCMSSSEGGEACAWCSSGAVGTSCQKESEAKTLPSAVFECEYQTAYAAY